MMSISSKRMFETMYPPRRVLIPEHQLQPGPAGIGMIAEKSIKGQTRFLPQQHFTPPAAPAPESGILPPHIPSPTAASSFPCRRSRTEPGRS